MSTYLSMRILRILYGFIQPWLLVFLSSLMWNSVDSEVYESIQWNPLNPKFHFSEDQFKNGLAFHRQIVSPLSQINIICPNVATIPTNLTRYPLRDNLYENLWMVGEEEFFSCKINSSKKDNHLIHICNKPDSLHYYTVHFVLNDTSWFPSHHGRGRSIYFLATSDGTKESINQTSGGHCMDPSNGISMRIQFEICETNSSDPSCHLYLQSVANKTKDIKTCRNTTVRVTALKNDFSAERFWEVLAITLGVMLVVSFIIHSIFLICYCVRKNKKPTRQSSHQSQKGSEEPLKSLIVDPHHKKTKHGRVSAAL